MDDGLVEKYIYEGNSKLLLRENLSKIEKKEYHFIGKYIQNGNSDIRDLLLLFLLEMNQSWCYKWFLVALEDDNPSIRVTAAKGILKLKNVGSVDELLAKIENELKTFPKEDHLSIPFLIKSVGNIGNFQDVERLKKVLKEVTSDDLIMKDIEEAILVSLTKLGDGESVATVERMISSGSSNERMRALEIVASTEDSKWVQLVIPLLNDFSIAKSYPFGPIHVKFKVCDFAVNTLLSIDSSKEFSLKPLGRYPYSHEQIEEVKKKYGLDENEKK